MQRSPGDKLGLIRQHIGAVEKRPERLEGLRRVVRGGHATEARIAIISEQLALQRRRAAAAEAERQESQRVAEEAAQWRAIERLRREPTEENARSAKRAFLWLAKRHHPDQGGSPQHFLQVKDAYA